MPEPNMEPEMDQTLVTRPRLARKQPANADADEAMLDASRLMKAAQAAERLGVTERMLERLRSVGDGPDFVRLTARTIRYRSEALAAFVARNTRRNTAE